MSDKNIQILLEGIIQSIDTILNYTKDHTLDSFKNHQMVRDAVLMQLLVLGETANRIPQSFRDILPEVEWGRIIRSRHIIAHDYQGIDYQVIWRIITVYLPPLRESINSKLQ